MAGVVWCDGVAIVSPTKQIAREFAHVEGAFTLVVDETHAEFTGSYAQCVMFRDSFDLDDVSEIVPEFGLVSA